ncbi:DUF4350 domain-containing protein [Halorientalis sp.]|jgi:hypothetical protein|uniref:DUF4350 domain-containing protein n=1 Tax=Halorientalis sp. TaxID=1931229 RepID=UPI00260480A3|nr:DUF4350 domain-containing protein [Halorientalis sp.]
MANVSRLAGVFVVVLALVLVVAAAMPLLASSGGDANPRPQNPASFQPGNIIPEDLEQNGSISIDASGEERVVLIDQAHDNDFDREDIEPMVDALIAQGYEVRFHGGSGPGGGARPAGPGSSSPLNESLRSADAFVVISPERRFSDAAQRGLVDFADRGGRVALLGEPTSSTSSVISIFGPAPGPDVTSQMTPLSSRFDMSLSTGYLFNMFENGNNFQNVYASASGDGPLTEDVDRVLFDRATNVNVGGDATVALSATDRTALSATREQEEYSVAAVNGNVALVGDTSFLTPENHNYADNEVFISNLAEFLVTGQKEPKPEPDARRPGAPPGARQPRPPAAGQPPTNDTTPPTTPAAP